jgi:hypothetical protein
MMGVFPLMGDPQSPLSKHPMAARVLSEDSNVAMQAFAEILREFSTGNLDPVLRRWTRHAGGEGVQGGNQSA